MNLSDLFDDLLREWGKGQPKARFVWKGYDVTICEEDVKDHCRTGKESMSFKIDLGAQQVELVTTHHPKGGWVETWAEPLTPTSMALLRLIV